VFGEGPAPSLNLIAGELGASTGYGEFGSPFALPLSALFLYDAELKFALGTAAVVSVEYEILSIVDFVPGVPPPKYPWLEFPVAPNI